MKLTDLKSGTYAAVRVLNSESIKDFVKNLNTTATQSKERRLHVTLLYSRIHLPNYQPDPNLIHTAKFVGYDLFDWRKEEGTKCLVMKLSCPTLVARHTQLMSIHPATYDFPTYQPHITVGYDVAGDFDVGLLPAFDQDIILGEEYSEDLIL